jgi:hypothetical protein
MGVRKCDYRVLVEKPEEKRQVGCPTPGGEENITMDLQGVGRDYGLDQAGSG